MRLLITMNPLDIELLSLCQTAKLAMLIDKQIQPKKKLRTVLPKLINKLTPEAAGRLNRDLNRKSEITLLNSFEKVYSRLKEVLEIHSTGVNKCLASRVEQMVTLLQGSPVNIQQGGERLLFNKGSKFQSEMGTFWIPENTLLQLQNNSNTSLTFVLQAKRPSVHHWIYEVLFAYGFNPESVERFQCDNIVSIETDCVILGHTPMNILSIHTQNCNSFSHMCN